MAEDVWNKTFKKITIREFKEILNQYPEDSYFLIEDADTGLFFDEFDLSTLYDGTVALSIDYGNYPVDISTYAADAKEEKNV